MSSSAGHSTDLKPSEFGSRDGKRAISDISLHAFHLFVFHGMLGYGETLRGMSADPSTCKAR